ncbi:MAG: DEAD/DEAH box helicase [Algisphaera sp.]
MTFDDLDLRDELKRAVAKQGYTEPSPIQAEAIPLILAGRDVMGAAQTGTGKTAAFTLPLLHRLMEGRKRGPAPRALVLTPTRELAAQVAESIETYGTLLPLKSAVVFGGVGIHPQINKLRAGVDILIATPGRLLDLCQQGAADLGYVETLILDEADRMLDMGFLPDIRRILKQLPSKRQNLLFSATFSRDIRQMADKLLHNAARVEVAARNTAAERVKQTVYPVAKVQKRELLTKLIDGGNWYQALVFTRTKHGADRLAKQLNRVDIDAAAIHGDKSQGARTRALAKFKDGNMRVLVATDIAARGLDIDRLPHVVNFELPNVPEDYVHRIGRTGRAGEKGEAVSLVCAEERDQLKAIERLLGSTIEVVKVEGFEQEKHVVEQVNAKGARGSRSGGGRKPRGAGGGRGRKSGGGGGGGGGSRRGGKPGGGVRKNRRP